MNALPRPEADGAFHRIAEVSGIVRKLLQDRRRIVIKVGTSTLTHPNGHLHIGRMEALVRQLADLHAEGRDLVLVSSGAVGAGMGRLGLPNRPKDLAGKQALAAVGQGVLMHRYEVLFGEYGCVVGQVLLTRQDLEDNARRSYAAATMERLFDWRVIPIVNENDTVSSEQIRVGDNDTLSARVAVLAKADLLILLSDVDGLYPADPRQNPGLEPLAEVSLAADLGAAVGGAGTPGGTGGMVTKVQAARICAEAGIPVVLAAGGKPGVLREILAGETVGTLFM
jgi:glutamate 5-kinase